MSLVQLLPDGPLDVIGDVHGEYDALCSLLGELGYDEDGNHPEGRHLVFIGDLCDRGPNSPAVFELVEHLVHQGTAQVILGNHEINLLRNDPKAGSGWFFEERQAQDTPDYAPFEQLPQTVRSRVLAFIEDLPLVLEREDLRIVHAAWVNSAVQAIRAVSKGGLQASYTQWEQQAVNACASPQLQQRMLEEKSAWPWSLEDKNHKPPMLPALAEYESNKQMLNPVKVLTSGVEEIAKAPFYTSGKWRFADRVAWWDNYCDETPVLIGHYWRSFQPVDRSGLGKEHVDLFEGIAPMSWFGQRRNVFCVDFSVGGMWKARKDEQTPAALFRLGALRWPEGTVMFHDGESIATEGLTVAEDAS